MTTPGLPSAGGLTTLEDVINYLYKNERAMKYLLEGQLNTKNISEVGGWMINEDSFMSVDSDVGFSTLDTVSDDLRIWAGSASNSNAPFRVYESGHAYMSNLTMAGGSITWSLVNPPTSSDVGALPLDSPKISQLSDIGDYLGALAQGQVVGLPGKLTYIGPFGIYSGVIGTDQLIAQNALIGTALIETLTVGGNVIMGPNAFISWNNVTGTKPETNADNTSNHLGSALGTHFTTIGPNYVYTGTITADQINTTNLAAEKVYQSGSPQNYVTMGGNFGDMILHYNGGEYFTIFNNQDGVGFDSYGRSFLTANLSASIGTFPIGKWDFLNATVANLNVVAKFG
jgi:hypothetical protein